MKGWIFATRRPADQVGWVDDFYLNERANQEAYNSVVGYPYPDPAYPRLTRTYVYLRSDYKDMPEPDDTEVDVTFPSLKLVDYKQVKLDDPTLDSMFVGIIKTFERRPMSIDDHAIGRDFNFGGTFLVEQTIAVPGQSVEEGITVVDSKTEKKSINTEILETRKLNVPSGYIKMTAGGSGYTSNFALIFTGGTGSGAAGTATVGKAISSLTLVGGGSGYMHPPMVVFDGGGEGEGEAQAIANMGFALSLIVEHGGYGYTSAPTVTLSGGGGSGATASSTIGYKIASTTLTAAGSGFTSDPDVVVSNENTGTGAAFSIKRGFPLASIFLAHAGTGYTSNPVVAISGGTYVTAAQAQAVLSRSLASITVTGSGTGFYMVPTVNVLGGGTSTPATAVARMKLEAIDAITAAGTGYTAGDVLTLAAGTATTTAQLTVSTVNGGGGITGVTVSRVGDYSALPNTNHTAMAVTGGTGTGATFTGTWQVLSVTVTDGSDGYESLPSVTFTAPDGGLVTTTQALSTGGTSIKRIKLEDGAGNPTPGVGYTKMPSVTITGGGGSGAKGHATPSLNTAAGTVVQILIDNPGEGYSSAPTLTISGGGGTGATGTVTLAGVGKVVALTLTAAGTGYNKPAKVTIGAPAGGKKKDRKTAKGSSVLATTATVTSLTLINAGTKFTSAPTISFVGGGGSGASATATLAASGSVIDVSLSSIGSYTAAPTVSFANGAGTGAAATYVIDYWPTLWEVHVDEREGVAVNMRKRIVAAGTRYSGSGYEEIQALDKWRSVQIVSSIDLTSLPAPEEIAGLHNVSFPDTLLSILIAWSVGYDVSTQAYTGYLSCTASSEARAELVVTRKQGYRGAANAIIQRRFFFGVPAQSQIPTVPVIQGSFGTVIIRTYDESQNNTAGTPGGHSTVIQRDHKSIRVQALDIGNVLTNGVAVISTIDGIEGASHVDINTNLASVKSKANSLGIITDSVASSLVFSYSDTSSDVSLYLPESTPSVLVPLSYLLVASEVEKWRFGLYVLTLVYVQIPSL